MRPSPFQFRGAATAGWLGPWIGVAGLGLWSGAPSEAALVVAAAGLTSSAVWGGRRSLLVRVGQVVILAGVLAGFAGQQRTSLVLRAWDEYWAGREERVGAKLDADLASRLADAEAAADDLATLAPRAAPLDTSAARVTRLRHRVSALALYGASGELLAWDGEHRGRVPEEVQAGRQRYAYGDMPLFGYLYVTAPVEGGGTAMAAVLLNADLPRALGTDAGDFASAFRAEVGEGVRIVRDLPPDVEGAWDLTFSGDTLFSVVVDRPVPAERAAEMLARWRLGVAIAAVAAWVLLILGGARGAARGSAAVTLVLITGVLPFQEVEGLAPLFDGERFDFPGPFHLSLGRVAALALAAVTLIGIVPRPGRRLPPLGAGLAVAGAYPLVLAWLGAGPGPGVLARGQLLWIAHQGAEAGLLTLLTAGLLSLASGTSTRRSVAGLAVLVSVLLAAGGATLVWTTSEVPGWWPALWGVPVAMVAASGAAWPDGWQRSLASWVLASVLAGTAALPTAWSQRVDARFREGEAYLERIAAPRDPELEEALVRVGVSADSLAGVGRRGARLLHDAWRAGGLADLGHPAWLTLWSGGGLPEEELRVGVGERPGVVRDMLYDTDLGPGVRLVRYDRADTRYVLRVPVEGGRVFTAAAPPFAEPTTRAELNPLFAGGGGVEASALTLIPLSEPDAAAGDGVRWVRAAGGWRSETALAFPEQPGAAYHVHYLVALPTPLLAVARATILLVLHVTLALALRLAGQSFLSGTFPRRIRWRVPALSFRARVTLALFGFFVLANAIFGTLAYRTLDGASHRAAQVLAERATEDAAGWYLELSGRMPALAGRVGGELLQYRGGELVEGSVEELVQLGLYEGWMPAAVHRQLAAGEGIRASSEAGLGDWSYVTAYRRLPAGDVLAAQVPLQAGATAVRARDVVELLGFALVVGAALSLGLALLVGRALTSPLSALQVASERVGAGNLGLRLPEGRTDEFGAVFLAFNRMVGRLRKARRQLVRTARRTRAIMDEAAVGMVALDPAGRVRLVNARAEKLVETDVAVGEPFPSRGALGSELAPWLASFMAGDAREAVAELHAGSRRFRVRARRVGIRGARGGAVVALEDVTDELRTERVLAWGEMARQVAHEVKNPLTPIKLSVQHIRRAWDDRQPDFDAILVRNADAMLKEIDRLAEIARSFSRFGAPTGSDDAPLVAVDLAAVIDEVLTLYGAPGQPARFEQSVPPGLPAARARVAELKEVLVNLLENARSAVGKGGCVRVEAALGGGGLDVTVADDGAGVPADLRSKVFEPHFSTQSGGTGLGLAIVRRLVESWGGTVSLDSAPGMGTTVTVHLEVWSVEAPSGG